jgi:hypothetical protein
MSKLSEMLQELKGEPIEEGRRGGSIVAVLSFMDTNVGVLKSAVSALSKSPHAKDPRAKKLLERVRKAADEVRKLASEVGVADQGIFIGRR